MGDEIEKIYYDLQDYRNSESFQIFRGLARPRIIFNIYLGNYLDLKKELERYYSHENSIFDKTVKSRFGIKKLIRYYQNVLTSARIYVDTYVEDDLSDSFHCFMKELRNYSIHKEVFPLSLRIKGVDGGVKEYESIQVEKLKKDLLNQTDQTKKRKVGLENALKFIEENAPEIILSDLFEDYFNKLNEHYNSLILMKVSENREELYKIRELTIDINYRILSKGNKGKGPYLLKPPELRYLSYLLEKVS